MKTTAALAAKAIKQELKQMFPTLKFRVKSENFSMGSAVNVYLIGTEEEYVRVRDEVGSLIRKYEYGSFDGMTDSYDYDNVNNNIPQAKYVQFSWDRYALLV